MMLVILRLCLQVFALQRSDLMWIRVEHDQSFVSYLVMRVQEVARVKQSVVVMMQAGVMSQGMAATLILMQVRLRGCQFVVTNSD